VSALCVCARERDVVSSDRGCRRRKKVSELWTWRQVDDVLADTHIAAINSDYMMICRANQSCGRGTRLESSVAAMTSIDVVMMQLQRCRYFFFVRPQAADVSRNLLSFIIDLLPS